MKVSGGCEGKRLMHISRGVDDVIVHVQPVNRCAGSPARFRGSLVHCNDLSDTVYPFPLLSLTKFHVAYCSVLLAHSEKILNV